jgi:hypothetical protein
MFLSDTGKPIIHLNQQATLSYKTILANRLKKQSSTLREAPQTSYICMYTLFVFGTNSSRAPSSLLYSFFFAAPKQIWFKYC